MGARAGPIALIMILLLASGLAQANVGRDDTFAIQDSTRLQYHAILSYPTPDAKKERALWDADNSSSIDAAEAAAYESNASSSRLGAPTANLRWDGNPTHWMELGAATQGFVSTTYNGPYTLILDGIVNLTSSQGTSHTLTITNLSSYASYSFAISLPSNWTITNVTGVSITSQSQTSVAGAVNVNGLAVIQLAEIPPPPPPPIEDTTPPEVDAGPNRTVQAGVLVSFSGSAVDDDPGFPMGATFGWAFSYNDTPQLFTGQNLSYTFWALGPYTLTFSAADRSGNQANATVHVVVESPDQQAPVASAGPDIEVVAGELAAVHGAATDNDPSFNSTGLTWWNFTYNGTAQTVSGNDLAFVFWKLGTFEVVFFARDGWGNLASDGLVVAVQSPDTVAPFVSTVTDPVVPAGVPVLLRGNVSDNDPSFPAAGQIWWTFTYNGSAVNLTGLEATFTFWALGAYTATLTAVDPWGNRNAAPATFTVVSPDQTPPVVDAGTDDHLVAGAIANFTGTASDDDPTFAASGVLWWTFDYGGIPANLSGGNTSFRFEVPGTYTVTFWAHDGWGNKASDLKTVVVDAAPTTGSQPSGSRAPDGILLTSLILVGLGLAALGVTVAYRRRQAVTVPLAPAAGSGAALRPTPRTPLGPSYVLEGLLVLYKDGRLIYHAEPGAESKLESPEVLGSMFAAVTEFIRDSFREAGSLSRLSYGEHTIVLERSPHLVGAAISYGAPDSAMREKLRETLKRLELAYAGVVEGWNGDRHAFRGIEALVAPLLATTAARTRAEVREASADRTVKVLSGTEHYRGYVRLKVAVANLTNEKLSNATLTVGFNEGLLVLARVEPTTLERQGATVRLGDVAPGERVGAVYYLDPQVCGETDISGKATYRDASGAERTVAMKTRQAEIICPIFFTPDHANSATLKRLVETAIAARDAKIYRVTALPASVPFQDLFDLAARVVSVRDVKLVRMATAGPPFSGRAWFYGRTKYGDEHVVVRVAASERRRAVEFFVAANSGAVLTGFLAELDRTFAELLAEELRSARLEPVLDETLKAMLTPEEFSP